MKQVHISCFFLISLIVFLSLFTSCDYRIAHREAAELTEITHNILDKNGMGKIPVVSKVDTKQKTAVIQFFYSEGLRGKKSAASAFSYFRREFSDFLEETPNAFSEEDYTIALQICYTRSKTVLVEASNQSPYSPQNSSKRLESLFLLTDSSENESYHSFYQALLSENTYQDIKNLTLSCSSLFDLSLLEKLPNLNNIYANDLFTEEQLKQITALLPLCKIRSAPDCKTEQEILIDAIENRRLESISTNEVLFFLEDNILWRFYGPGLQNNNPGEKEFLLFQTGSYEITKDSMINLSFTREWKVNVTQWQPSEYMFNGNRYYSASEWKISESDQAGIESDTLSICLGGSDNWSMDSRPDLYLQGVRYTSDSRYLNEAGGLNEDGSNAKDSLQYLHDWYEMERFL